MLSALAIGLAIGVALTALILTLAERRRRRRDTRRNGRDFVAWDWPQRPVNGHDHPEPPELQREPQA